MTTKKLAVMITAAAAGLAAVSFAAASPVSADSQNITAEQAKTSALNDAGLSASQVEFIKVERGSDNDVPVYDIEFKNGRSEYDYTINAVTGAITEKDNDIERSSAASSTSNSSSSARPSATVSAEAAKATALADAGVSETDVTALKVHADSDNDAPVYDIEFKHGRTEYDYTVNAVTGTITDKDIN